MTFGIGGKRIVDTGVFGNRIIDECPRARGSVSGVWRITLAERGRGWPDGPVRRCRRAGPSGPDSGDPERRQGADAEQVTVRPAGREPVRASS